MHNSAKICDRALFRNFKGRNSLNFDLQLHFLSVRNFVEGPIHKFRNDWGEQYVDITFESRWANIGVT